MVEPTPTPWAARRAIHPDNTGGFDVAITADSKIIAEVFEHVGWTEDRAGYDKRPAEANAALIVKAVNAYQPMLEALERCLPPNVCLTNRNVRDDTVLPLDVTMGDLRQITAALALAKGEPQP